MIAQLQNVIKNGLKLFFFFFKRDENIAIIVSGNQNVSTQLKERLPLLRR